MTNKLKNQKGFTIIEVLIVLAIAGLILLVVFLAIPALQRNSRNTQRKSDVQSFGGALQESINNKAGKVPANQGDVDTAYGLAKLGYFNTGAPTYKSGAFTNPKDDKLYLAVAAKCDAAGQHAVGGTARQMAILYTIENAAGATEACQDV